MEKVELKIIGVSCEGCARGIEGSFKNLNGVFDVKVNFDNKELYLEFDEGILTKNQIVDYIKKIGYGVENE